MQKYYYIIHIQYLGYRYHGWMHQPKYKTIQGMVNKTCEFILGHTDFKTIGASRTDAKVSANKMAFELFLKEPIDAEKFLEEFNYNLPTDIRVLSVEETDKDFNIINSKSTKEYLYFFCLDEKPHPFCASIITYFKDKVDLELMKEGAKLFEGSHNFVRYSCKPTENTIFEREIITAEIVENDIYTANFFPEKSYAFRVVGEGFLRYQVRYMMAQLLNLGEGKITLEELKESLKGNDKSPLRRIAPSSGLMLNDFKLG